LSIDEDFWSEKNIVVVLVIFVAFQENCSAQSWLSRLGGFFPLLAQPPIWVFLGIKAKSVREINDFS
jgi:hypothetical protein